MIPLHTTGHMWASDGSLLRVDIVAGKWEASRFDGSLVMKDRFVGNDEAVHNRIVAWSDSGRAPRRSTDMPPAGEMT